MIDKPSQPMLALLGELRAVWLGGGRQTSEALFAVERRINDLKQEEQSSGG